MEKRNKIVYSVCTCIFLAYFFICGLSGISVTAQETFDKVWEGRDAFDEIWTKYMAVNEDNCAIRHVGDLKMEPNTVSHLPDIKEININPVFPNRTALLHLHNMALNRAFFFSFISQSRLVYIHFRLKIIALKKLVKLISRKKSLKKPRFRVLCGVACIVKK